MNRRQANSNLIPTGEGVEPIVQCTQPWLAKLDDFARQPGKLSADQRFELFRAFCRVDVRVKCALRERGVIEDFGNVSSLIRWTCDTLGHPRPAYLVN